jgi:hypothetical protein
MPANPDQPGLFGDMLDDDGDDDARPSAAARAPPRSPTAFATSPR